MRRKGQGVFSGGGGPLWVQGSGFRGLGFREGREFERGRPSYPNPPRGTPLYRALGAVVPYTVGTWGVRVMGFSGGGDLICCRTLGLSRC